MKKQIFILCFFISPNVFNQPYQITATLGIMYIQYVV